MKFHTFCCYHLRNSWNFHLSECGCVGWIDGEESFLLQLEQSLGASGQFSGVKQRLHEHQCERAIVGLQRSAQGIASVHIIRKSVCQIPVQHGRVDFGWCGNRA